MINYNETVAGPEWCHGHIYRLWRKKWCYLRYVVHVYKKYSKV